MAKTKKTVEIKNVPALKLSRADLTPFIPDYNDGSERWCQPLVAEIKFNNQFILTVDVSIESSDSVHVYLEAYDPMTTKKATGEVNLE